MPEQFGSLTSSTPRPSTGSPTSCAGRSSTASWSPARRCARSRSPTRWASPGRPSARRSRVLVAEGLATREPNRGVSVVQPRPRLGARHLPRPPGARGRRRTALARRRRAGPRRGPHLAGAPTRARSGRQASYQELNERHLAFHVSLVGLTGSPRLVAMAESLMVELRLALAQVDRIRRNAHDQADSHTQLVMLLERGDVDGAVGRPRAAPRRRRGRDPRARCDLATTGPLPRELTTGRRLRRRLGSPRAVPHLAGHQRRRPRRGRPGSSTASASTGPARVGRGPGQALPLLFVALILGIVNSFVKPVLSSCRSRSSS